MKKNSDAKNTMLVHSEAKITLYKAYLEAYIQILGSANTIKEINIFDVFCGRGIYNNKKKGSPLVAFDVINKLLRDNPQKQKISFVVNDNMKPNVNSVRQYIESFPEKYCNVEYSNIAAQDMFKELITKFNSQTKHARNLMFIDPYGYKEIKKDMLYNLLINKRTEIILFLPISQMQRFSIKAINSDDSAYSALRIFVESFFSGLHPIKKQTVSAIDYINYVKDALKFDDKFYSSSYSIERDNSNYYALFYIGSNLYGLEKFLQVKWKLDKEYGRGFEQPKLTPSLFEDEEKESIRNRNYMRLESIIKGALEQPKNNFELYSIILAHEFLPKHAANIFDLWHDKMSNFEVIEIETQKKVPKGSYYVNWNNCNPVSNKPKVIFRFRK